jgi:hypothetical protein
VLQSDFQAAREGGSIAAGVAAMTTSPRIPLVAALAASLCLTSLACQERDEAAKYQPEAGEWTYMVTTLVQNTCPDGVVPADPAMTFLLDYDGGDTFSIERGEEDDLPCEMDGASFTCGDITYSSGIPGSDAVITWTATWEGEFLSETEVEGNEITRVTCAGDDCVVLDDLPCTVNRGFEGEAIL